MKFIVLLSILLLSLGTSKTEAQTVEQKIDIAYWYGTLYGTAGTLCGLVAKGMISKDVAQGLMNDTAQFVISDPDLKDITIYLRDAYQEIKKDSDSNCPL